MSNKEQLENILMDDNVVNSINNKLNKLLLIIPEIRIIIGFDHKSPHHHLDIWNHTLMALSMSEKDLDIRLSLLLHDIGKPLCCTEINGIRYYRNHPYISSILSRNILERLGYEESYINKICYLIKKHDDRIIKEDIENNYDLEYKRFCIQICDTRSHNPIELEKRNKYVSKIDDMFSSYNKKLHV